MHGRLRVKTSAQQEAEKLAEREKKRQKYQQLTAVILEKYKNDVFDEETILQIGQILAVNPDFYTLWNYRRKILLHWKQTKDSDYVSPMLNSDLQFTEQCLTVNPKSYHTWNQRCWLLEQIDIPDWEAEIKLCDKCLKLDCRNFHCWDYRRVCVERSSRSLQSELTTSDTLISRNFSNYSSWHYRSQLLTELHAPSTADVSPAASTPPSAAGTERLAGERFGCPLSADVFERELELVQNAAFTDPGDQAPWFYYRWLFGSGPGSLGSGPRSVCVVLPYNQMRLLVLALAEPVCLSGEFINTTPGGVDVALSSPELPSDHVHWRSVDGVNYDTLWSSVVKGTCTPASVSLPCGRMVTVLPPSELICNWLSRDGAGKRSGCNLSASSLSTALDNLNQLAELEPDNKWVLLTQLELSRYVNTPESTDYDTLLAIVYRLTELDTLRAGYYSDLKSGLVLEREITAQICSHPDRLSTNDSDVELQLTSLSLTSLSLRSLALSQQLSLLFVHRLNLSNNHLRQLDVRPLLQLRQLIANNNQLQQLYLPTTASVDSSSTDLPCSCSFCSSRSCLQHLELGNNCLTSVSGLCHDVAVDVGLEEISALVCFCRLDRVDVTDNPVVEQQHQMALLSRLFPNADIVVGAGNGSIVRTAISDG